MSQHMSTTPPNPMSSPDSVTVGKPYLGRAGPCWLWHKTELDIHVWSMDKSLISDSLYFFSLYYKFNRKLTAALMATEPPL